MSNINIYTQENNLQKSNSNRKEIMILAIELGIMKKNILKFLMIHFQKN